MQKMDGAYDKLTLEAFVDEIEAISYDFILKHTIQIFYSKNGYPSPAASAVLITLDDRYFMISAGHVFEDKTWPYVAWLRDDRLPLDISKIVRTKPPINGDTSSDKYDIAMLEFDDETAQHILSKGVCFLPLQNMDLDNKANDLTRYRVVGFIASQTKVQGYSGTCQTFNFRSLPQSKFDYKRFGFIEEHHIAVAFDGKASSKETGNLFTLPKAEGISGCGVWSILGKSVELPSDKGSIRCPVTLLDDTKKNIRLAGIVIEQVQKESPNKALIATQIYVVIGYLIQCYKIAVG